MEARLLLHPVIRDALPPRERHVLMLSLGLIPGASAKTVDEIATRTGMSVHEAQHLLSRARLRLHSRL